jgi:hypothetical protein
MFEKTVFSFKGLEVKVSDHATEDIKDLLDKTILGHEGGLRYSLQNTSSRIDAYKDKIRFITLLRNNKIMGTIGACFRETRLRDKQYATSHLRYLTVHASYQTVKRWRVRKEAPDRKSIKEESFKQKLLEYFRKPYLLDLPDVNEGDKHIMYAYVESRNEKSKNLIHQAGYEYIRSFLTVAFSRFFPKTDKRVVKLKEEEKPVMEKLLSDFYKDYSFYTSEFSFFGDRYYVIKENNEIVAGVNAIPTIYKVVNVPGIWGWVMMEVLPFMPYYRKLFRPGEFRYLVFGAIYYKKGHEKMLSALFESICAEEGYNTGLTWLDDRGDLFDTLRKKITLGALNRMLNAKPGLVYARFVNLSEEEKESFYDAPAYIAGFDFS